MRNRCAMAYRIIEEDGHETYERCIREAIEGDEVCEPCRAAIENLLHNASVSEKFRKILADSTNTPNAKNGDPAAPGHRGK
jgi:hypothetical protein